MKSRTFILRNLTFFRRIHIWVLLGVMASTAILVGALIVGDSVRHSLRQIVFARLGKTEFAMTSGDRFFRVQVAQKLSEALETVVAPILQTRGIAVANGGQRRVNNIQVVGVDTRFGDVGGASHVFENLSPDEVIVNHPLSVRLGVQVGDVVLLRIEKLDFIPKDAPLALDTESSLAKRLTIKAVAGDEEFGRFHLKADQVTPLTAFISLSSLASEMPLDDRANGLLVAERTGNPLTSQAVRTAFRNVWTLADAGLTLVKQDVGNHIELRSDRVFMDAPVVQAAVQSSRTARPVFTYFVNQIHRENRVTPYSFVVASGPPAVPLDTKDNEIILNEWLAEDLQARRGDTVELVYYVLGSMRELVEARSSFRVKSVVPLRGVYRDESLLPDFPGLAGETNCRDWKPGFPIDLNAIRKKDEDYWSVFRGTPKAFVTLKAAQRMWENRFGRATAVRFTDADQGTVGQSLLNAIDPADLGYVFQNVQQEGLRASMHSVNFARLFLGLSFSIIVSALLLTGLLFVFHVEKRSEEYGLLLALGYRKRQVRRLMLLEGAVLIFIGGLLGSIAGIVYNQILLQALKTVWVGVVGTSALKIHVTFSTVVIGTLAGWIMSFLTIGLVARKQASFSISDLQKGVMSLCSSGKKLPRVSIAITAAGVIAVSSILVLSNPASGREAFASFFSAGSFLLISGLALTNVLFHRLGKKTDTRKSHLTWIGLRNTTRRRTRSIALVGLLASGLFIVFTVGANRTNAFQDAERRESGTGGFAFFGESALPILYDLNGTKGRQFYGLDRMDSRDIRYVQFRVKEGEDASCLNLNHVSRPQLIGVNPEELAKRKAFTFTKTTSEVVPDNPWSVLSQNLPGGIIPAVADQTVIAWGLGKAVGDTMTYVDHRGDAFQIKLVGGLANSIFQGNIIISEEAFIQKYPSISGYRLFLVDAPFPQMDDVSEILSRALQDYGLDLSPAAVRLAEFNTVQNTYLSIFLILGSFGLILGSIGIGIVVRRNVMERRGELALLRAIGFRLKSVQALILAEHAILLVAGIFYGIVSALLATLPSFLSPGSRIPFGTVGFLLVVVLVNGALWTFLATQRATQGDLLPALRSE